MKTNTSLILLAIYISIAFTACFDVPDEFVAPVWDVEVNVPVSIKTYTLADIIEDDPNFIVESDNPSAIGRITYVHADELTNTSLDESLTLDGFSSNISHKIEEIKTGTIDPITLDISVNDWMPAAAAGTNQIIPPFQAPINSNFNVSESFESITFSDGQLNFQIKNNLPVPLEVRGFEIRNSSDGSIVFSKSSASSDYVIVPPNDSAVVPFNLQNKTVPGSLRFHSQVYTPGSNGQIVFIPSSAAMELSVSLVDGFTVRNIVAPLPVQEPIINQNTIAIQTGEQPTQIQRAVLSSGFFNININNYFDLDITLNLSLENVFRADGSRYSKVITIGRKEKSKIINEPSLSGWIFDNNGVASELVSYRVEVTTESTEDPRVLSVDDSVSLDIDFGDIALESFIGKIKPTVVDVEPTSVDIDLGEVENTFSFQQISLDDPNIILAVSSPTTFEVLFNGKVDISNGIQSNVLHLENVTINPGGNTLIELKDYGLEEVLNSFTNKLPYQFTMNGSATVNPDYLLGSISAVDSINGDIEVHLPLNASVAGGILLDTVENTLSDDIDEEDIENLNYAKVRLELTNEIPVELACVGAFNDEAGAKVLNLPPRPLHPSNKDTIFVDAPRFDQKGNYASAGYKVQELELFGDEVIKFLKSPEMAFQVKFITPPNGSNLPVVFNINDELNFKVSAKASYRVDLN